jgi:endonuclease/exonuclease/phosphatase family metal-dependent hydrolase
MSAMKLLSANIEGDLHLDRIVPFVTGQDPDIVCLQEVFEADLPQILGTGHSVEFLPMMIKTRKSGQPGALGIAIATAHAARPVMREYYYKAAPEIAIYDEKDKRNTISHGVIGIELETPDGPMTVCTTHFTWTPNGLPDVNQQTDLTELLQLLKDQQPHILCGDFNIPRKQNSLYGTLAAHYTDNIPSHIVSSVYLPLHYVRNDPVKNAWMATLMVDYIFSTPDRYRVAKVELHGGVSDHFAFTANIEPNIESRKGN